MNEVVLLDTGFWIALFDPGDADHERANRNAKFIESRTLLVPWPVLYETLRTKLVRNPDRVTAFDTRMNRPGVELIDDRPYRSEAYRLAVESSVLLKRPISMVDMLCRLLIVDTNVQFKYMVTTNPKDFSDLCQKHGIEML